MSTDFAPRTNPTLIGHASAQEAFLSAFASGRMHHAWLMTGPKGIGKATLAYRVARAVLAGQWEVGQEHPVFRRLASGAHTDVLVLEPPKDAEKDEAKREIPIEQAREVGGFLALTPAEGEWRVVIIDSVDELNLGAANAILKLLEEPPPRSLLLLVSHNPGGLLPTIRSRCRQLKIPPLSPAEFHAVMRLVQPSLLEDEIKALGMLADHSPGVAQALHLNDGIDMYKQFINLAGQGGLLGATAFAEMVATGRTHTNWQVMAQLVARFFSRTLTLGVEEGAFTEIVPGEEAACRALLALSPPALLAERTARAMQQFSLAARLHLDYKTVLLTFLHSLHRPVAA